jgi:hypothetical protein
MSVANARSLSPDGVESEGPVGPIVTDYSMIRAGSMDEAVEIARGCPVEPSGASISIFEVR